MRRVAMGVRSLSEHRKFYGDILGFAEQPWSGGLAFRLGDSLLLLEEDGAATVDRRQARGWRYITLQIADIDAAHAELRSKGVREGLAPMTLGDVARISMIFDPDGNWIELSRRLVDRTARLQFDGRDDDFAPLRIGSAYHGGHIGGSVSWSSISPRNAPIAFRRNA
jgi:catechol 2,3-dioxygenase-like lactoylglutathione lyase family enzyme